MKGRTYIHYMTAHPFRRMVVTIVGDPTAGLNRAGRLLGLADMEGFKAHMDPKTMYDGTLGKQPFCLCGRTVFDDRDVVIWFPRFPYPSTLVHELEHAKDYILGASGVKDTEGEVDAYMLGELCRHFFRMFEIDVRKSTKGRLTWSEGATHELEQEDAHAGVGEGDVRRKDQGVPPGGAVQAEGEGHEDGGRAEKAQARQLRAPRQERLRKGEVT